MLEDVGNLYMRLNEEIEHSKYAGADTPYIGDTMDQSKLLDTDVEMLANGCVLTNERMLCIKGDDILLRYG